MLPVLPRVRGHSTRPGACPSGRGRSTPLGTGFLSPYARHVPGREKMHPHAQDVPGRRKNAMWTVRMGGLIMVGSHPGASRATPLASSQPQLNHLLRAFTRTPTARIRRATALSTSLTFRAVTLPLRTSVRRPLGLDTALTSSRLLPPRQGHECSGRRCHGRHHPSCQRAPAALLGLHNTGIPRQDSRPCGHRRHRYPPRAFRSPTRGDGRGIPRGRGHFYAAGGVRRRRGPESCPPTRSLAPAGRKCTPTRRISPAEGRMRCGQCGTARSRLASGQIDASRAATSSSCAAISVKSRSRSRVRTWKRCPVSIQVSRIGGSTAVWA